jgi:ABC-type multidrug transport system fused ATPase/permease subunit
VFNSPYDEDRYKKRFVIALFFMLCGYSDLWIVLYQCALEPDLELFEAGDETEVGEKGLTLSGGQKLCCAINYVILISRANALGRLV